VTVLSRCQRFDLKRVDPPTLLTHLQGICANEGANVDEDGLKLIVRAAEGSVRDALSLLDQAIVQGEEGAATGVETVRQMLGLADRSRTFDLFEAAVSGDGAKALTELDSQHSDGADPVVVMRDLLDHCHDVTRAKALGEAAAFAEAADHIARIRKLAEATAMGHLSRAWQMLLRAHDETRTAPDPLAAAEMALLRLAHAAGLPPPEAAAKLLAEGGAQAAGAASAASSGSSPASAPSSASAVSSPQGASSGASGAASVGAPQPEPTARLHAVGGGSQAPAPAYETSPHEQSEPDYQSDPQPRRSGARRDDDNGPSDWRGIIAMAADNRDLMLKTDLERFARPVRVEQGRVVFQPTGDAPAKLATTLARALQNWTGHIWFVHADDEAKGGETVAETRAREAAEERAEVMKDPAVAKVMELWPGADITDIRARPTLNKTPTEASKA